MAHVMTVLFPRGANGDHTPCRTSRGRAVNSSEGVGRRWRGQGVRGGGRGVLNRLEMRGQDRETPSRG